MGRVPLPTKAREKVIAEGREDMRIMRWGGEAEGGKIETPSSIGVVDISRPLFICLIDAGGTSFCGLEIREGVNASRSPSFLFRYQPTAVCPSLHHPLACQWFVVLGLEVEKAFGSSSMCL